VRSGSLLFALGEATHLPSLVEAAAGHPKGRDRGSHSADPAARDSETFHSQDPEVAEPALSPEPGEVRQQSHMRPSKVTFRPGLAGAHRGASMEGACAGAQDPTSAMAEGGS
jgi:hypothetical protein